jgi:flagellar biosynthesis/type III secretory pathway chaperone
VNRPADDPATCAAVVGDAEALATRLLDVLQQETALLRAMRVSETARLQAEKAALVGRLRACSARLRRSGREAVMAAGGEPLLAVLERLDEAIDDNQRAVAVAKDASERVVEIIRRAALPKMTRADRYGLRGRVASGVASVAINTRL